MTGCQVTYVGSATFLLDVPGARADHRSGTRRRRHRLDARAGARLGHRSAEADLPALGRADLVPIDAVLLSHDEHFDNLDGEGRRLLGDAATTIITPPGAARLGARARGLLPWESTTVPGHPDIRVTAVPARHGPEGTEAIIGDTTGFVVQWGESRDDTLYVSGDTVLFEGLEEIGCRFEIGTAIVHLGSGGFDAAGDLRLILTARASQRHERCGTRTATTSATTPLIAAPRPARASSRG